MAAVSSDQLIVKRSDRRQFFFQSADRNAFKSSLGTDRQTGSEHGLIVFAGDGIVVGGSTDLSSHNAHGVTGLGQIGIDTGTGESVVEAADRDDLAGGFTQDGIWVRHGVSEFGGTFGNGLGTGDVVGTVVEEAAGNLNGGTLTVLDNHFALSQTFGFADAGHEVKVTGIPFGVEVPVGGTAGTVAFDSAGEEGSPVAAGDNTGRKEVNTFVVFPALEVNTDTVIVFSEDFENTVGDLEFRNRTVILLEHGAHIFPVPFGGLDHESVEFGIDGDGTGSDFKLRVKTGRTDLEQHLFEIGGAADTGEVQIGISRGHVVEAGTIQSLDDAVDAFAVFRIFEAVFFSRDQHRTGTIAEFDRSHLSGTGIDALGTDSGFQIIADSVGIGILEHVGLGDDKGIGVVTDDFDLFGTVRNVDFQLSLNIAGGIAAGDRVVVGTGNAGDGLRGDSDAAVGTDSGGNDHRSDTGGGHFAAVTAADSGQNDCTGEDKRDIEFIHDIIPFRSIIYQLFCFWHQLFLLLLQSGRDFRSGGR